MELICVGFLAGAIFAVIVCGAGIIYGRGDKGQYDIDTDVRVYVPIRDRSWSGDKRVYKYSNEEMIFVLHNLKRLTHGWERDIVDAMIEEKEGRSK